MVIADIFPQAHLFSFRISKKFLNDHKILKRIRSAQLEKSSAALWQEQLLSQTIDVAGEESIVRRLCLIKK